MPTIRGGYWGLPECVDAMTGDYGSGTRVGDWGGSHALEETQYMEHLLRSSTPRGKTIGSGESTAPLVGSLLDGSIATCWDTHTSLASTRYRGSKKMSQSKSSTRSSHVHHPSSIQPSSAGRASMDRRAGLALQDLEPMTASTWRTKTSQDLHSATPGVAHGYRPHTAVIGGSRAVAAPRGAWELNQPWGAVERRAAMSSHEIRRSS